MVLAENSKIQLSASIAFVRSNILWAMPKPKYANPKSSYFASGNPYTSRKSKSTRKNPYILALVFSSVDIFTFVKYVHER